jgi:hypothetical protein
MARTFDDASSQYLELGSAVVTDPPFSISAWFYCDDDTNWQTLVFLGDSADDDADTHRLQLESAGASVVMTSKHTGWKAANTSVGYSENTWHHACGIVAATDDRSVFIDGGSKGTNNDNEVVEGVDQTSIGRNSDAVPDNYFSGSLAEIAIWNTGLSDAEAAILAKGYSPLFVHPENLVAYWPLIRDSDDDYVGGHDMTAGGGPTIAAHMPKLLYPAPPHIIVPAGVGVSASASVSPSVSPSPSPGGSGDVCWGHDTGVLEANIRNFSGNWTGTGQIFNPGVNDIEYVRLQSGEYMISEIWDTGDQIVELLQNEYAIGDDVDLDYRHGATPGACAVAGWNNYTGKFTSLGYVQVRITSTL